MKTYILTDQERDYLMLRQDMINFFLAAARDASTASAVYTRTTVFNRLGIDTTEDVETDFDFKRGMMLVKKKKKEKEVAKPKKK